MDGTSPYQDLVGRTLGVYRIEAVLGQGGMGVVFRAVQTTLNRIVALKTIRKELAHKRLHLERFRREIEACARLRHPHIITIFDYGETEGYWYYAMEYIEGRSMAQVLRERGGALGLDEVLQVGTAVAEAMVYFHQQGLVHRDIKPANVLRTAQGAIILMDFGLVKAERSQTLTEEGRVIGTPAYVAPEILRAEPVDARTDIYQLGVVLYELATGKRPFGGREFIHLAGRILDETPRPPRARNGDLPASFDLLCATCLAKEKDHRYRDGRALLVDLERIRSGKPLVARPGGPSGGEDAIFAGNRLPASRPSPRGQALGRAREPGRAVGLALGLGLFLLLVAGGLWRHFAASWGEPVMAVEPREGGAVLRWTSSRPYPSRVVVARRNAAGGAEAERTEGRGLAPTREHRLRLAGLPPGTYDLSVLFPDGSRSKGRPVQVAPVEAPRVSRLRASYPSWGVLRLRFHTSASCRARIRLPAGGSSREVASEADEGKVHEMELHGLTSARPVSGMSLILERGGSTHERPLSGTYGVAPHCERLARTLKAVDVAAVLTACHRRLAGAVPPKGRAGRRRGRNLLGATPEGRALLDALTRNRSWLAGFFAQGAASLRGLQWRLYRALCPLAQVDAYFDFREWPRPLEIAELVSPFVRLTYEALPEDRLTLVSWAEEEAMFVPRDRAQDPLFNLVERGKHRPEVTVEGDLSPLLGGRRRPGDRIGIGIRGRNCSPDVWFEVAVNERLVFDLRNTGRTFPGSYWSDLTDRVDRGKLESTIRWIVVWFPASLLPPGPHRLRVTAKQLAPVRAPHLIILYEVAVVSAPAAR